MIKYVFSAKNGDGDITDDNGNVIEFTTPEEANAWAIQNDVSDMDFDIDEITIPDKKTPAQIQSESIENKKLMDEKIRRTRGDVQASDIFPRTFDEDVNTGIAIQKAIESPSIASIANVPRTALLQSIGTGLDLASIPGRVLRSTGRAVLGDNDSKMETFLTKLPEINPEGILEGTLVDPLTFLTMGSPTGRVIDAGGTIAGRVGTKLPALMAPRWREAVGTGALETAVQAGIGSYDEPTNPAAYAPSLVANTLLGRYGVRGTDLMSEGEKMLYKNLLPSPTQAKTSKVLSDASGTKPLLERGIARVGKEPAGTGMLARLKENVADIGKRQDEIRYGEPSETNIFASTGGDRVISDNLGIGSDITDDELLKYVMKNPDLSKHYDRMLEITRDPKTALNSASIAASFEPHVSALKAEGFEEIPTRLIEALNDATEAVGESNIRKFGTEERKIRNKLLSRGGDLYEDFKDLGSAGITRDDNLGGVAKNLNSVIDYKRKLDKLASEYGSFDKPSIDQTAKARLYREASDEMQKYIDRFTSDDAVSPILEDIASKNVFENAPLNPNLRSMTGEEIAEESYKFAQDVDKLKQQLLAPEMERIGKFRDTQQDFAELLPWRDVIEDRLGRLNAGNESILDISKSGITDKAVNLAKSAFTGYPTSVYSPKGNIKQAQKLYDAGKKGVTYGNLPKKGIGVKAVENVAREGIDYLFPEFNIEADRSPLVAYDEPTVDLLTKGGSSKVKLKAPMKRWKSVDDIK